MINIVDNHKAMTMFFAAMTGVAALGAVFVSAPAMANAKDYRCAGLAEQAASAADSADASKQRAAKRFVAIGNKLCEAGNGRDAAKQYRLALRSAGVEEAAPAE